MMLDCTGLGGAPTHWQLLEVECRTFIPQPAGMMYFFIACRLLPLRLFLLISLW
jgi:hypothetical protein